MSLADERAGAVGIQGSCRIVDVSADDAVSDVERAGAADVNPSSSAGIILGDGDAVQVGQADRVDAAAIQYRTVAADGAIDKCQRSRAEDAPAVQAGVAVDKAVDQRYGAVVVDA